MNINFRHLFVFFVFSIQSLAHSQSMQFPLSKIEGWVKKYFVCSEKELNKVIVKEVEEKLKINMEYTCGLKDEFFPLIISNNELTFVFASITYNNRPEGLAFLSSQRQTPVYWEDGKLKTTAVLGHALHESELQNKTGKFLIHNGPQLRYQVHQLKNGIRHGLQSTLDYDRTNRPQVYVKQVRLSLNNQENGETLNFGQYNLSNRQIYSENKQQILERQEKYKKAQQEQMTTRRKSDGLLGLSAELGSRDYKSYNLFYSPNFRAQDIGGAGYYGELGYATYENKPLIRTSVGVGFIAMFITGFLQAGGQFGEKEATSYDLSVGAGFLFVAAYTKMSHFPDRKTTLGEIGLKAFLPLSLF